MDMIDSILLGLVQGITQFLPISSSGHLILLRDFLSVDAANALAYDAVLHLATTVAVITYFWSDLWVLVQAMLRKLGRLPVNEKDMTMFYALALGTIPAVVLGVALEPVFDKSTVSPGLVAMMLFASSVFLMYVEWRYYTRPTHEVVTAKRGFLVGLFQALALLPGFSHSGVTLAGGMLHGMSRYEAARFSFLLAIPITLGVGSRKFIGFLQDGGVVDWGVVLVGAGVAAVTSFLVIHFFLTYIKRYTLWPFIWYSVVLSALVGYVAMIS
jgi:undecaprenyl-diphosphatase